MLGQPVQCEDGEGGVTLILDPDQDLHRAFVVSALANGRPQLLAELVLERLPIFFGPGRFHTAVKAASWTPAFTALVC